MADAGAVALGSAYGDILIDNSQVERQMNKAFDNIGARFGSFFEDIGAGMQRAGDALTTLTAPLLAFGVTGIRTAANFDDAMREVQARTGATAEEMETLRETAMQLGADTVFSASQAANAFLQLLTSGQSVKEAMATLPEVLNLAAAAKIDLGNAADWTTDIMKQFGLEAGQAYEVVEALVRASGSGSATVTDLALGFQNAGNIASNFGLDVYETAAALQVFSENGIKGAEAGTQLKSMLTNMSRQTEDVQGMWERLGVSMYDAQGNVRDLDAVIDDLNTSMEGMSDQERINTIQTLAGSYGQAGLSALLASGGIDEMQASMSQAADAATVADTRMGGWNGATEALMGSLETLQITVLTPLINNQLVPFVNKLTEVANGMIEWANANPELANRITEVLALLAVLGPSLIIVGKIFSSLGTIIGLASTALFSFGGVGIIVAALVGAWATNFGGLRDSIDETRAAIKDRDAEGALIGIGKSLLAIPKGIAGLFVDTEKLNAWVSVWNNLKTIIGYLPTAVDNFMNSLGFIHTPQPIKDLVGWLERGAEALGIAGKSDTTRGATGWEGQFLPQGSSATMTWDVDPQAGQPLRDNGGRGRRGLAYLIGTGAQPEMFVPDQAGEFYPADQLGGGDTYQINLNVTPDELREQGLMDRAERFADQFKRAVRRDGGGLAGNGTP